MTINNQINQNYRQKIDKNIVVSKNDNIVQNYTNSTVNNKIYLQKDVDFKYLLIANDSDIKIEFTTQWTGVKWNVFAIFFGNKPISANIVSHIHNSFSQVNIFLLSFVSTDKMIDVQGSVDLWKNISKAQWHLLEKNIIIAPSSSKIKIKAVPRLDVYSNDVQATHGVSIDRISEESLFYLTSKWLAKNTSQELVIKWYIQNILEQFTNISDEEKNNIENTILSQIIQN